MCSEICPCPDDVPLSENYEQNNKVQITEPWTTGNLLRSVPNKVYRSHGRSLIENMTPEEKKEYKDKDFRASIVPIYISQKEDETTYSSIFECLEKRSHEVHIFKYYLERSRY